MMEEHGVEVDHATLNRWVLKYVPLLEQEPRVCMSVREICDRATLSAGLFQSG
jgi:hypothetical protein